MIHHRYKTLGINSSKKPFNTGLWWEHSTYGLVMVDSTDQTVLLISTDKGDNWSIIDLSDNTNSYKIQAGWLDGNDLWLLMCDNDGTADDFEVCFIELDDSNDCNPVAVSAGADANTVFVLDIFKFDTDIYVFNYEERAGDHYVVIWDVDTNPFVEKDTQINPGTAITGSYYGIVTSTVYYGLGTKLGAGEVRLFTYTFGTTTIAVKQAIAAYTIQSENQKGVSYDNINLIYFVAKKVADGLSYLLTYDIADDSYTVGAVYNIALQLDRNNSGVVPNELEKAFGVADEIVYEIKARRSGIVQVQDLSATLSTNIIAITDNFLMADDTGGGNYPMFEWTEVTKDISFIDYKAGIMGIRKVGEFVVHPDLAASWNKGDSIKIYDQYDQLEFWGIIKDKNQNSRTGLFVFDISSFTNEVYDVPYEKDYTGDDTDTKQKDMIDNALDFDYRESSIVGTTTTYDYEYNRAVVYLFWLARRLERQVPYIEPDGKVWTKLYSALAKNAMIYPGTYNFRDGFPSDWADNSGADCDVFLIDDRDNHREVMRYRDNSGVNFARTDVDITQGLDTTFEFWVTKSSIAANTTFLFQFREGASRKVYIRFEDNDLDYRDSLDAWTSIKDNFLVANTLVHIKLVLDDSANTFDCYIDGVLEGDDLEFNNNSTSGVDNILINTDGADTGYSGYIDALGVSTDPNYTVGDNEVAWDLNNHWQDTFFVDIPGIKEVIPGFFDGNTGITRNTIRYKNNQTSIRPEEAVRDPIELLKGALSLKEFRDSKIEEDTEAEQLGDNRYAIFSADTKYLGLRVSGQGYLQPGKTIHIENTGSRTLAESNLLLISFWRDPKNDVYYNMILTDNIIFPKEFVMLGDTSRQQAHAAAVQSIENQMDINAHLTREGGLALRLTNKTGVASVKGTIVEAHAGTDNAFRVCDANSVEPFGVVYENGIADGEECIVVIGGRVQVLLKDLTLSTRNNWVGVSDVAGRAIATGASPPAAPTHFKEIGHCIESKGADTDVLAFCILHFL